MIPPTHRRSSIAFAGFISFGLFACLSPGDEGAQRVVGYIDDSGDPPAVTILDTARAGVSFTLTVTSYGTPCTTADGARVLHSGWTVTIIPYDRVPSGTCVSGKKPLPRQVALTFPTAGFATITVRGRAGTGGTITVSQDIEVLGP